jgi:flagellin
LQANIGAVQLSTGNGYTSQTFTVTSIGALGEVTHTAHVVSAEESAHAVAAALSANLPGVSATGFNQVTLDVSSGMGFDLGMEVNGHALHLNNANMTTSQMAVAINADVTCQQNNVYAIATNGNTLNVYSTTGYDIQFTSGFGNNGTVQVTGVRGTGASQTINAGNQTATAGGALTIALAQGYTLATTGGAETAITETSTNLATEQFGKASIHAGNFVGAQTLKIANSLGICEVEIAPHMSAENIAAAVNERSDITHVTASAVTMAKLSNLSQSGSVYFELAVGAPVTAVVARSDLTRLMEAINEMEGEDIKAIMGDSNAELLLIGERGQDIVIQNFTHSSAENYQNTLNNAVIMDGSGLTAPNTVSIQVTGNPNTHTGGTPVTLLTGGLANGMDSTVIGGHVAFSSPDFFSISSNLSHCTNTVGLDYGTSLINNYADREMSAESTIDQLKDRYNDLGRLMDSLASHLNVLCPQSANVDSVVAISAMNREQMIQQGGALASQSEIPQNALRLLR